MCVCVCGVCGVCGVCVCVCGCGWVCVCVGCVGVCVGRWEYNKLLYSIILQALIHVNKEHSLYMVQHTLKITWKLMQTLAIGKACA